MERMLRMMPMALTILGSTLFGAQLANAQSCTDVYPVTGLIGDEYSRLGGENSPLGCPIADEEPVLDRQGGSQEFENGQMSWSPESGNPRAFVTAYYKETCTPDSACIVFRWRDMPDSDVFVIRLADQEHAGLITEERNEGQLDLVVASSEVDIEDVNAPGFDPAGRVFRSGDETLGANSGAIGVKINRYQPGRYKFSVKACTRDSAFLGIGEDTECPFAWSNTVFVDYEFIQIGDGLDHAPTVQVRNQLFARRRNAAMRYACARAGGLNADEASGDFSTAAMALLGTDQVPLFGDPSIDLFSCPRTLDNLTKFDTPEVLARLSQGDDVVGLVGGSCDYGQPGHSVLKNECVVAMALRGLRQKKVIGTNLQVFDDDSLWADLVDLLPDVVGDVIDCPLEHGDYDFELMWIVRIMLSHGPYPIGDGRIDETTWRHLLGLLSVRGVGSFDHLARLCGVPVSPETENHTWMIEAARYITNEILALDALRRGQPLDPAYDNQQNGQEKLILKQLRRLLIEDFYEFNSRPYQGLAVDAIRNLYEVGNREGSKADRVSRAAEVVLDYLSGRFSLSSNGLRRVANFRRQPHRAAFGTMFQMLGDRETTRMELLMGTSVPLAKQRFGRAHPFDNGTFVFHGTGRIYRVPQIIADYFERGIRNDFPQDVLQRFRSRGGRDDGGMEIHFSTPSFMLSAGGVYVPGQLGILGEIFGEEQSSPLPTTLLISKAGRGWQEMLRFTGIPDDGIEDRFNTCVGPSFACGIDPVVPSNIPAACMVRNGKWTFFNFDSSAPDCGRKYGVHVALWQEPCEEDDCSLGGSNWGLMEAKEVMTSNLGANTLALEKAAFEQFQSEVLGNNAGNEPDWDQASATNKYRTTKGTDIVFQSATNAQEWSVTWINGNATPKPVDWPIAQGDVMNGQTDRACVEFDNAFQNRRLILDLRDTSDEPSTFKCEVSLRELQAEGRPKGCWMANPCD